jgi:hypothetical protein
MISDLQSNIDKYFNSVFGGLLELEWDDVDDRYVTSVTKKQLRQKKQLLMSAPDKCLPTFAFAIIQS